MERDFFLFKRGDLCGSKPSYHISGSLTRSLLAFVWLLLSSTIHIIDVFIFHSS
ncbi:hypothetical protein HanXRQr2_Chr17g0794231 [Helianthus annuus]|uniref:Uncharacterized protein n=1 Tax=Helianthus annuus TaxID=4232 RepID=A0A9K3DHD1_HELAN|nr:hypothetical protein HanXRQr2_Chr17g0794231 [Helianthus annuus]